MQTLVNSPVFLGPLSPRERLQKRAVIGQLLDFLRLIYRNSTTTKTSLKSFTIKSTYVESWLKDRRGYPVTSLLKHGLWDATYARRQMRRSVRAGRIKIVNQKIEPAGDALADLEQWASQAGLDVWSVSDPYQFAYSPRLCWLLTRLCELAFLGIEKPSFLGLLVELAILEHELSLSGTSPMTSQMIEARLDVSKSTISSLLHGCQHRAIQTWTSPNDLREINWGLSQHVSVKAQSRAIEFASSERFRPDCSSLELVQDL